MKLEPLLDGLSFGEGPRWRDDRLYFSDFYVHQVRTVDESGKAETIVDVPGRPSGLGWRPDGTMLIVSMTDRRLMRFAGGKLTVEAELGAIATGLCNDMVVDAKGRAYVGNFGFDRHAGEQPRAAVLARVDPDGSVHAAADELMFPNGTVITPDGKTMIIGETFARRLTVFDIATDGTLGNRLVWADLDKIAPDGICLDAEGAVWVASPRSNEFVRVLEGGTITRRIQVSNQAIACALGGDDGKRLFMVIGRVKGREEAMATRVGRIEYVDVDVPAALPPQ